MVADSTLYYLLCPMQGPGCPRVAREIRGLADSAAAYKSGRVAEGDVAAWPEPDGQTRHLHGVILGPADTPYAGGHFHVAIEISEDYPFGPPKVKFTTPIWHPNVSSQTGAICLDILKNEWSPALNISSMLTSLQALLCAPEPDDPQDAEVASQYKRNRAAWEAAAKDWTARHASPDAFSAGQPGVAALVDMGFDPTKARRALAEHGGDIAAAAAAILAES